MNGVSRKLILAIGGFNYGIVSDEPDDILNAACARINLFFSSFPRNQTELSRRDALVMLQLAVELVRAERSQHMYGEKAERLSRQIESCLQGHQLPSP